MKTVFESWIDNIGAENGFILAILGEGKNTTTAKTNKPPSKAKSYEKKATKKKLYTE